MKKQVIRVRANTYFKGGPGGNLMSGKWIGNDVQEDVMFVNCQFNGVRASFKNCTFIDCDLPPQGEDCTYIDLPPDIRCIVQRLTPDGTWK